MLSIFVQAEFNFCTKLRYRKDVDSINVVMYRLQLRLASLWVTAPVTVSSFLHFYNLCASYDKIKIVIKLQNPKLWRMNILLLNNKNMFVLIMVYDVI